MEYRILGNTGLKVSTIALGCEGFIGKTAEETRQDFDFAISQGINFVDIYSSNPELREHIGQALLGRRESFVIQAHLCTVWEDGQYQRTRDMAKVVPAFGQLLSQLQTSYVDVGMIHYVDAEDDLREVMEGPVLQYALQLKREGRIHHLGLSSHNPKVAIQAVESGLIDVLMFSINPAYDLQPANEDVEAFWDDASWDHPLTNIDPDRERLYSLCEQLGVGIDVMKIYGGGDLLSPDNSPFGYALSPVQCAEYALSRPAVAAVMVGCRSVDEMKAALAWCEATDRERDYTAVMQQPGRFSWRGHCMYCGHCAPCSAGIDIASVNKFYNLCVAQKEIPETVREHYRSLKAHAGDCLACGLCESRCPFGVSIVSAMEQAATLFGY